MKPAYKKAPSSSTKKRVKKIMDHESQLIEARRLLQVETALEKVRVKALKMKRSDELKEVIAIIFNEIGGLGFDLYDTNIGIIDKATKDITFYGSGLGGVKLPPELKVPYLPGEEPYFDQVYEDIKRRKRFRSTVLKGKRLQDYHKFVLEKTDFKNAPKEYLEEMLSVKKVVLSYATMSHGILEVASDDALDEDNIKILKRFASVVDLTYTRFDDLQKAEAQAREAQIETALERVRAQTMAMQDSNELQEVAAIMYEEFIDLGFDQVGQCGYAIIDVTNNRQRMWLTQFDGNPMTYFNLPLQGDPLLNNRLKAWESKEPFLYQKVKKSEFSKHLKGVQSGLSKEQIDMARQNMPNPIHFYNAHFNHGYLHIVANNQLNTDQESILLRFAKVFEQTYTRFLDLKKAEAQAREGEIQLALERVRAQTMAMHSSKDIGDCILKMFGELTSLGVDEGTRFGIGILNRENETNQLWTARKEGEEVKIHIGNLDMTSHPLLKSARKAWKEQVSLHRYVLEGDDLLKYYQMINTAPEYKLQVSIEKLPEREFHYGFIFDHGFFYAFSLTEFQQDLILIAQRFSAVFEQTYRRFLDLQKAEAQAREAEIQLALERVRAKTMAMQNSSELADASFLMANQVRELGIKAWGCAFHIYADNEEGDYEWFSNEQGYLPFYKTPREGVFKRYYDNRQSGESLYIEEFIGDTCTKHYEYLMKLPVVGEALRSLRDSGVPLPTSQIDHVVYFSYGYLLFITYEPVPEAYDIFERFAKEFEQTYTRFLDLKKAEEQAREAEIQLALERVRAKTMAMHKSDELSDTASVMFQELKKLGINSIRTGVCIFNFEEDSAELWLATEDGDKTETKVLGKVSGDMHPLYRKWIDAGAKKKKIFHYKISGNDVTDYYKVANAHLNLPKQEDYNKSEIYNGFFFPEGSINVIAPEPLTEEELDIGSRFANVFGLLYRRFLDLKKAEAQAREAQIEAALERIRYRSLIMRDSGELNEVIAILFKELNSLNLLPPEARTYFCDINANTHEAKVWMTYTNGEVMSGSHITPLTKSASMKKYYEAWKRSEPISVREYKGNGLKSYLKFVSGLPHVKKDKDYKKLFKNPPNKLFMTDANFLQGNIGIMSFSHLSDEALEVLQRFAKVFEFTYTRFLDLQKSESQAREAQIEAALERIRARSMAMHHSDELQDVINLVLKQLQILDFEVDASMIIIVNEQDQKDTMNLWIATGEIDYVQEMHLPYFNHPIMLRSFDGFKKKENFYADIYGKKEARSFMSWMVELPDFKELPDSRRKYLLRIDGYARSVALAEYTGIAINNYNPHPFSNEENEILKRIAKVFDQTYTRFLDLQKAEAQAREAQIEAALERIRAKALAMQSSGDLHGVSMVLREQMGMLGQPDLESSIVHLYNSPKTLESWYTFRSTETNSTKVVTDVAFIPVDSCTYIKETLEKYKSNETEYTIVSKGKKLADWYNIMVKVAPDTIEYDAKGNMLIPKVLYYHHSKFSGGALLMISNQPPSEGSKELQRRAARVFNFAYQRFLDLKKAESQAREAVKQASLDRVRGEIASMRSKEDLKRITPLVWQELTNLNVSFIRCGVLIMDEENNVVQTHLSTPDGKTLGIFDLPADSEQIAKGAYTSWKEGKIFQEHWSKSKFIRFMKSMIKHGRIDNPESYQGAAAPPESLYLNFLPFKQGMLYVGNTDPLSQEHLDLAKSLANALSIAYARYEDFSQLEAANNQIQKALDDLRSTQTQLVHAEKMASLGELTAGIAHEIQNPLNFVNNFSEVSKELIEELKEERIKQGEEREKGFEEEIIEDIIQNLEKINHHGQRASSIVKGMLEHSRSGKREKEFTDINNLADEYLRLSYHGLRAKDKTFNAEFRSELDPTIPKIRVIGQDIGRVLLNLINNAFYAVSETLKEGVADYKPEVLLRTKKNDKTIEISVQDNGGGIPKNALDKIFQPFFTTKPTGQGTGLGLSLSYDIVTKGHDGHLEVETHEGIGSTFCIQLPIK